MPGDVICPYCDGPDDTVHPWLYRLHLGWVHRRWRTPGQVVLEGRVTYRLPEQATQFLIYRETFPEGSAKEQRYAREAVTTRILANVLPWHRDEVRGRILWMTRDAP